MAEFEWDATKAAGNRRKHGVSFDEAITVFADPLAKILDDPDHSSGERRELIVGHSSEQRLLVVSFTERSPRIRIIGARVTTAGERKAYEEHTEKNSGA
jgi:uncharacterized protein